MGDLFQAKHRTRPHIALPMVVFIEGLKLAAQMSRLRENGPTTAAGVVARWGNAESVLVGTLRIGMTVAERHDLKWLAALKARCVAEKNLTEQQILEEFKRFAGYDNMHPVDGDPGCMAFDPDGEEVLARRIDDMDEDEWAAFQSKAGPFGATDADAVKAAAEMVRLEYKGEKPDPTCFGVQCRYQDVPIVCTDNALKALKAIESKSPKQYAMVWRHDYDTWARDDITDAGHLAGNGPLFEYAHANAEQRQCFYTLKLVSELSRTAALTFHEAFRQRIDLAADRTKMLELYKGERQLFLHSWSWLEQLGFISDPHQMFSTATMRGHQEWLMQFVDIQAPIVCPKSKLKKWGKDRGLLVDHTLEAAARVLGGAFGLAMIKVGTEQQRAGGGDWHAHLREWKTAHPGVKHKDAQRLAKDTYTASTRCQAKTFRYEFQPARRRVLLPDAQYADEFAPAPADVWKTVVCLE